jgi:hypothetical protein
VRDDEPYYESDADRWKRQEIVSRRTGKAKTAEHLSVRVPLECVDVLWAAAESRGITIHEAAEQLLAEGIKQWQQK